MTTTKARMWVVCGVAIMGALLAAGTAAAAQLTLTWNTCDGDGGFCDTLSPGADLAPASVYTSSANVNDPWIFQSIEDSTRLLRARAFRTELAISPYGEIYRTFTTIWE